MAVAREGETPCRQDEGAALITALLIVAIMSIVTLAILDSVNFSTRMSYNIAQRDQARLYALGAEQIARAMLKENVKEEKDRYPVLDAWTRSPMIFPIDGGSIEGRVRDGANCFNLNAVVKRDEDGLIINPEHIAILVQLYEAVGIARGQSNELANALADWIDTDDAPSFGGAEDYYYTSLPQPYRTSGDLLADVSELRQISGYNAEVYRMISPFVCALPNTELQPLNVNSLDERQLPLLAAYLGEGFDLDPAMIVLSERPVGGFATIGDFLSVSVLKDRDITSEEQALFALKSSYYRVEASVRYLEAVISLYSTLQIMPSGDITTLSRRYGTDE